MDTLTVLLHSKNSRTVHEAVTALHYITTDSDQNKLKVTELQGLVNLIKVYLDLINQKNKFSKKLILLKMLI